MSDSGATIKRIHSVILSAAHRYAISIGIAIVASVITNTQAIAQMALKADSLVRIANDPELVEFALTLPLRNQSELQRNIASMYDAKSRQFRHFLSVAEFQDKYAPSPAQYAALRQFAVDSGLTIVRELAGRTSIDVSGNVATVRSLFNVQMYWRQAADGRNYLWADKEPTPSAGLASIGGNAAVLRQRPPAPLVRYSGGTATGAPNAGTGPGGNYVPGDIRTAYNLNTIQNGGTPVALYELSTASYSDAGVYASTYGLNNPTLTQKSVGASPGAVAPDEVMLDIEMVMAVSNPTNIYIYTGNSSSTGPLDTYQQIANDNLVGQVSSSWYTGCESDVGASTMNAENTVFTQMVAQGMAVFIAQGDEGAYNVSSVNCVTGTGIGPQVLDPASQPYVTSAGGTTLTTSSTQAYVSESVWNDLSTTPPHGATGGGVSSYWSIPSYQVGLTASSSTMRNVPDMSLNADPLTGYYIYCSTCTGGPWLTGMGGTSAVAPQLAAFWSLVSKGLGTRAGFANPTLYKLAIATTSYTSDFHDITSGNNGYYSASAGYDNATGLGSYNGANLYTAVVQFKRAGLIPITSLLLQ